MKILFVLLALFLTTSVHAKEFNIRGTKARAVLEALVAGGYTYNDTTIAPVVPVGEIWVMTTNGFVCSYFKGTYHDGLAAGMSCSEGSIPFPGGGASIRNPMWVAQTLQPYAYDQSTERQYQITISYAKCIYTIASNKYACKIVNPKP